MSPSERSSAFLLLSFFCFSSAAHAQIPSVSDATSNPIPGAGHNYVGGQVETVNPANGSLSIRVPAIMPPARGISLPFSFAYDSGVVAYLGVNLSGTFGWQFASAPEVTQAGWSNTLPVLSVTETNYTVTGYNTDQTCAYLSNYVFQDPRGNRHNLGLVIEGRTGRNNGGNCVTDGPYSPVTSGGEGPILATTTQPCDTCTIGIRPVTITDGDGTVFSFPAVPAVTRTLLPTSIIDRNGNTFTMAGRVDTLGRTLLTDTGVGISPETVTISGLGAAYTLTWINLPAPSFSSTINCLASYWCTPGATFSASQLNGRIGVSSITLPNGKFFSFDYDTAYDMVNKITYPTGGYVRYVWGMNLQSENGTAPCGPQGVVGCSVRYDAPAVTDRYVSFDGTNEVLHQHFSYSTTWPSSTSGTWTSKQTTVTTYDLVSNTNFQTVYVYSPLWGSGNPDNPPQQPVESSITYYDTTGSLLKTVTKTWQNVRLLKSVETTYPNGLASETTWNYDANEMEIEQDDYDFGTAAAPNPPGLLLRATVTTYATSTAMSAGHVIDRPASVIVYSDAAKTIRVAETDYTYDSPAGTATSGIVQHGAGCNCGNLTAVSRWLNTSGTTLTTTFTNDDTGQRLTMTDPRLNVTQYSYADSYSSGTPPGPTNAYLTQVTHPNTGVAHIEKFAYAYSSGEVTSSTDQNNLVTSYKYVDSLARLTETDFPDGGRTALSYNDDPYNPSTSSPSITTIRAITSSTNLITVTALDGLGRGKQSQLASDPQGTVFTDTTYDALGRVSTVSNPYRSISDATYGISTTQYDALGRVTKVLPQDGSATANNVTTSYSGNCTTVTDQAGKSRKSCSDGLGRLTQVFEDPTGVNYETDYTFDALDNLLTVNQKGGSTNSADWRTRTFTYNSLSQLLTASNPESGTTTYSYDNNGNLQTKISPAPNQTGSATVTTSYQYDPLNRLTQKSFSDGTPTVRYGYDAVALAGCATAPPTLIITNGIGRRTAMCDAAGAESWSYDARGRTLTDARTTNAITKATGYAYNLDGSVASLTYPSGRTVAYTLQSSGTNTAGRMLSVIDSTGPTNYATGGSYAPSGALASLTNGASLVSTFFYNSRLQPCRISVRSAGVSPANCAAAAAGNVLDFTYNFSLGAANNGNATAITNNLDPTRSQTFTYDNLNRIATAKTTSISGANCWDEQFSYDSWGNLLTIGRLAGYTCSNEELLNASATAKNQLSGYCYDAAGNLVLNAGCPAGSFTPTYSYNAENQVIATAGMTYLYDGDGRRVEKLNSSSVVTNLYWYGTGSDSLDETDGSGSTVNAAFKEYIFFGGKRIASRDSADNVNYYFADHLGTARIVANSSGTVLDDSDFYPFGGERLIASSSGNHYKFTGKERDSESGLDNFGARYDSSSMGRFMSPDPLMASARLENPQSWNRYSYALNNPLRFTDPEGLFASPAFNCTDSNKNCLNDEQRRILNNSTGTDKDGNKVSGEALYGSLNEKQQNAFVNITDKLASVQLGDGTTALSQVQSVTPDPKTGQFAPDRIFANVSGILAASIQNSKDFTTVPAGLHAPFNAISFKDTGVTFGNIQFSFNQGRTGADIDIDIGNVAAKNFFGRIIGGAVHAEEVVQNGLFGTRTNQDIVRRILINNPKVQTITPSPDPKFNRP